MPAPPPASGHDSGVKTLHRSDGMWWRKAAQEGMCNGAGQFFMRLRGERQVCQDARAETHEIDVGQCLYHRAQASNSSAFIPTDVAPSPSLRACCSACGVTLCISIRYGIARY